MDKYVRVLLIFFTCIIFACTNTKTEESFESMHTNAECIDDRIVVQEIDLDGISRPLGFICHNNNFIIADDNPQHMLHMFSKDGKTKSHFLSKGHGKDEIVDVHQLQVINDKSFCIFDEMSNKILYIDIDSIYHVSGQTIIDDFLSLSIVDDICIGICVDTDKRYKSYNMSSQKSNYFGDYDQYGFLPATGKLLLQGNIITNPQTHQFAYFSYYGVLWQMGDYNKCTVEQPRIEVLPKYIDDANMPTFDPKTCIGFVSIAYSKEYVYALYSGKTIEQAMTIKDGALKGNYIFKFNWNGDIEDCYKTTDSVSMIAFDTKSDELILLLENDKGYSIGAIKE